MRQNERADVSQFNPPRLTRTLTGHGTVRELAVRSNMLFGEDEVMYCTAVLCQIAAVNGQRRADDESGPLRTQPDDHISNLLGRPQASDRFLIDDLSSNLRVTLHPTFDGRCPDPARAHYVDANSARDILQGRRLRQTNDSVFR